MKSTKDFRSKTNDFDQEDFLKKAAKLEPIKKSGKEKRTIFSALNGSEDDDDDLVGLPKRESILDYFDDGDEEELEDESEFGDDEELEDEEEFDDEDDESEELEEEENEELESQRI